MTSKEIIQEVIRELEYCQKKDTMYEAETNLLLPDIEQVLEDLEVLEMLKPFVKSIIEFKEKNINVLDFNISDSLKEKITEWLEDDK